MDCPVLLAEVPPLKKGVKTIVAMQYEMIRDYPYKYSSDDVIFTIYACKKEIIQKRFKPGKRKILFQGTGMLSIISFGQEI